MLNEEQQIWFTQLWTDTQPSVRQYVSSLVWNQSVVRDIVQNTSVVLLAKFSQYDKTRPFLNWALGVAKFEVLKHQRDAARNRIVCDSASLDQYTQTWAELTPEINDESTALRECMSELKSRSKTIVRLKYAEGLTSDAISSEINISSANVRTILKRTRQILKRCVERRMAFRGGSV